MCVRACVRAYVRACVCGGGEARGMGLVQVEDKALRWG